MEFEKDSMQQLMGVMGSADESCAARIIRLMIETQKNPSDLMPQTSYDEFFETCSGVCTFMEVLNDAFAEDGISVTFFMTRGAGPRLAFLDEKETWFSSAVMSIAEENGRIPEDFEPIRVLGVADFLSELQNA